MKKAKTLVLKAIKIFLIAELCVAMNAMNKLYESDAFVPAVMQFFTESSLFRHVELKRFTLNLFPSMILHHAVSAFSGESSSSVGMDALFNCLNISCYLPIKI